MSKPTTESFNIVGGLFLKFHLISIIKTSVAQLSRQLFEILLEHAPDWKMPSPRFAELLNLQYWTSIKIKMHLQNTSDSFYSVICHNMLLRPILAVIFVFFMVSKSVSKTPNLVHMLNYCLPFLSRLWRTCATSAMKAPPVLLQET